MSGVACLLYTLKGPSSQLEGNKKNPALCTKGITGVLPLPFPSQDKWEGWVRKGIKISAKLKLLWFKIPH